MSNHHPTIIVILGGGGDLAQRKLLPALFNLFIQNNLPTTFTIIGIARTERTNAEYQKLVKEAIEQQRKDYDSNLLQDFCTHIQYLSGSFNEQESYLHLKNTIQILEESTGVHANKLFYLAVPPVHYDVIFDNLHSSLLLSSDVENKYWARILVEKPFGNNLTTAEALDKKLISLFRENQIFRIDHYLAKEAVLNILSFRFANTLLRSAWNKENIEKISITMHEAITAQSRGSFYDTVGALRDVGQNHLLQILALLTMKEPELFRTDHIRSRRAELLQKLIPITQQTVANQVVRAQYNGYTETQGVTSNSKTETYFEFKAYINDEQWRDVPFYIQAGKALKKEQVVAEIFFRDIMTGPFQPEDKSTVGNKIILTISPVQSMNITLNVKKPGHGYKLETNTLSYTWDENNEKGYTAYEKVLLDCIFGDQTLFTTTEEVLASWRFISSIIENWEGIELHTYQQGSAGPDTHLFSDKI